MSPWGSFAAGFAAGASAAAAAAAALYAFLRRRYGRFLSFIAHEINTPLTSMNMTGLNFIRGVFGPLAKEQEEWMRLLVEQLSRMNAIVGDFRDLIHIEFHRDLRLNRDAVELAGVVRAAVSAMEGSLTRSGARLLLDLPEGLGRVMADEDRLQRVVGGLVAHAKKFRTKGPIAVSARAAQPGSVALTVAYQGPVLTSEQTAQMLELFYPVDRPKSAVLTCVGLGLGTSRELVERGGGRMTFEVDRDGTSRLVLRLPAAAGSRAAPGAPIAPGTAPAENGPGAEPDRPGRRSGEE